MLGRMPSLIFARLLAALLLATIGLQTAQAFEATPQRAHGSAFSASTTEVALAPQRRVDEASVALAPLPLQPSPVAEPVAPRLAPHMLPFAARPDSTGPPARLILARPAAPRAPPFA